MGTAEILPKRDTLPLSEAYELVDESIDPLEIAAQALAKLKEHGLSGYLQPVETETVLPEPEHIVTQNDQAVEESSKVAVLDEYRKNRRPQIDTVKQRVLLDRAKNGDESALEDLWISAQGTAEYVAGLSHSGWPTEDKIQTCLEVVPGAVRRFDPDKGASWKTYLIRRMIGALLDAERNFGRDNGISRSDYQKLQAALKSKKPNEALHELTRPTQLKSGALKPGFIMAPHLVDGSEIITAQSSLDELMFGSGDIEGYGSAAEPVASTDVFEEASQGINADRLRELVKELPEREKLVLVHHYGLFDTPVLTHNKIGEMLGITESRISQIYGKAMEHISMLWNDEGASFRTNRLHKFEQPLPVYDINLMKQMHEALDKLKDRELSEDEVRTVLAQLPAWKAYPVNMGAREYWLIERALPSSAKVKDIGLYNGEPERRKLGLKDQSVTMLVEKILGSDLQLAIDTEQKIRQAGYNFNPELAAKFSARELEVISNLFEPYGQMAIKLNIARSTVRTHTHHCMQLLGLSSVTELAVISATEGLTPLDNVPYGRTESLSPREISVLRDCYHLTYEEGARALGITESTYRTHWAGIFKKTGALSQVQAVLMAVQDKLIEQPTQSLEASGRYDSATSMVS